MRILSGNINLEVKDLGSKTHTPLIMISGFGSQLIDWPKDLIEKLIEKELRVIIFDNRDVGLSYKFSGEIIDGNTKLKIDWNARDNVGIFSDAISILENVNPLIRASFSK